ncbi:MAG: hypothetical protein V1921_04805 [Candidatus Altiarchaeota archaeon]
MEKQVRWVYRAGKGGSMESIQEEAGLFKPMGDAQKWYRKRFVSPIAVESLPAIKEHPGEFFQKQADGLYHKLEVEPYDIREEFARVRPDDILNPGEEQQVSWSPSDRGVQSSPELASASGVESSSGLISDRERGYIGSFLSGLRGSIKSEPDGVRKSVSKLIKQIDKAFGRRETLDEFEAGLSKLSVDDQLKLSAALSGEVRSDSWFSGSQDKADRSGFMSRLYNINLKSIGGKSKIKADIPDEFKGAFEVLRPDFFSMMDRDSLALIEQMERARSANIASSDPSAVNAMMELSLPMLRAQIEESLRFLDRPDIGKSTGDEFDNIMGIYGIAKTAGITHKNELSLLKLSERPEHLVGVFKFFDSRIKGVQEEAGVGDDFVSSFMRRRAFFFDSNGMPYKLSAEDLKEIVKSKRGEDDVRRIGTNREADDVHRLGTNFKALGKLIKVYSR